MVTIGGRSKSFMGLLTWIIERWQMAMNIPSGPASEGTGSPAFEAQRPPATLAAAMSSELRARRTGEHGGGGIGDIAAVSMPPLSRALCSTMHTVSKPRPSGAPIS